MSTPKQIEGIRLPETSDWIAAHTDQVEPPFEWSRLTGGTSNLTYAIQDAKGRRAVVRRPPTGKLLPKAHDMEREHKILSGLAQTPVPIARPLALCSDPEVTGAPFYVMEFREGFSVTDPSGRIVEASQDARGRIGASVVGALVELHKVDPADVGLSDLGRPDAYIARQLNRWFDSFQRSDAAAKIDLPQIAEAFEFLSARIPDQGPPRVCHGDYGMHNILMSEAGEVVAITDWEIGTLGDPLADIAYLLLGWGDMSIASAEDFLDDSLGENYPPRRELVDLYESLSGRKIDPLWFYIAFNCFKRCCITQGVYARFQGGVRGTQGMNLDVMRSNIIRLAEATAQSLKNL